MVHPTGPFEFISREPLFVDELQAFVEYIFLDVVIRQFLRYKVKQVA